MRFMMIMFEKDYVNAKPGWVPDLKAMEVMGKYNEQLLKAGVLLAVDGLTLPWMAATTIPNSIPMKKRLSILRTSREMLTHSSTGVKLIN
jgi:hypothetical protein